VKDWNLGRRESAIGRSWVGAAADVAGAEKDHVQGPNPYYARRLLCPRPSLAIPMVAGHPLDFSFPFSTLTLSLPSNSAFASCWTAARSLSRKLAISRTLRLPRLIILGSAYVQSGEVIAVAGGCVFHYWRCATSRGTIRNSTRNLT
jgi:hypothetical protein